MSTAVFSRAARVLAGAGSAPTSADSNTPWRILLVDADEQTRSTLQYVLRNARILGRRVELHQVATVNAAIELLELQRDFALVMLDIMFSPDHPGASLVEYLRGVCQMSDCRILLHTRAPWLAPSPDFLSRLDISDFRAKAELDHSRLLGSITAALRCYEQLRTIAESRRGLGLIVQAAAELMERRGLQQFAEGVLTQIAALLRLPLDGLVCVQAEAPAPLSAEPCIVAAAGALAHCVGQPLAILPRAEVLDALQQALARRSHLFLADATVLYLGAEGYACAVYLRTAAPLLALDQQLLEVFCANLSTCLDKLRLIEELNFLAYHDPLTQLANRAGLGLAISAAARSAPARSLVLLDLRRFADVNSALGFEVGNAMLRAVATRLRGLGRAYTLARLSGDVFGIVGPSAELHAARLQRLFMQPLQVADQPMNVGFAMASYELNEPDCDAALALQRASTALMVAKSRADGQGQMVPFRAAMEEQARQRLELVRRLRGDFEANRLALHYQPQVCLRSGRVVGVEALLRWPDGLGGFVASPDQFVPLAESSGLIAEIGAWALMRASADWAALQSEPGAPERMSVNVSMAQFRCGNLLDQVRLALDAHGLPAQALELEITESMAMDEPETVRTRLSELRELGVRIAVDDFGTGYSALSQLKSLPVDCLKMDRSFVSQIGKGDGDVYAETIVTLGRRLHLEMVAEGVESEDQVRFLRALGCQLAQGWLYAKAMPINELRRWLRERAASALNRTPGEESAGV